VSGLLPVHGSARYPAVCAALFALGTGVPALRSLAPLLPDDLAWHPAPGAVYVLKLSAGDEAIWFAHHGPAQGALAAAPLSQGTHVRLLRLEEDGLHRPRLLVRVLEGSRSGERGYVARRQLRHSDRASAGAFSPALVLSLLLSAVAAATSWALATLIAERQPVRSTAPRQAE
jgi:hypothetical protein